MEEQIKAVEALIRINGTMFQVFSAYQILEQIDGAKPESELSPEQQKRWIAILMQALEGEFFQ